MILTIGWNCSEKLCGRQKFFFCWWICLSRSKCRDLENKFHCRRGRKAQQRTLIVIKTMRKTGRREERGEEKKRVGQQSSRILFSLINDCSQQGWLIMFSTTSARSHFPLFNLSSWTIKTLYIAVVLMLAFAALRLFRGGLHSELLAWWKASQINTNIGLRST